MPSKPPLVSLNAEGRYLLDGRFASGSSHLHVSPIGFIPVEVFSEGGFSQLVFPVETFPFDWGISPVGRFSSWKFSHLGGLFDSEIVQQYHRQAFNHVPLLQLPLRAEVRETRMVDFRSLRTSYRKCHWQRWMSLMSVGVEESEESHGLRFGVEGGDEGEAVDSWRFSLAMFSASACSICS